MSFVAAALYGVLASQTVAPQEATAPRKIWQGFGVNIHFTQPAQGEMELLKASGVDYIRTDFSWQTTEKQVGNYDFSEYDRLLGRLKQSKIRPFFSLNYGNDLYEKGSPSNDKSQDAYARWAAAVLTHFKGEEIVWEIWNEPNLDQFWKPRANPLIYSKLALKAAKAMRAADPEARIVAPGVATVDTEFLRKALNPELLGLIDGVSMHPYRQSGPETVVKDFEKVQALIRATAPAGRENLPVICSEWGYSTYTGGQVNDERQAMYLAKLWILCAAMGSPVSIYYDWKDDGPDATNSAHRFGIVRSNLGIKPAFNAARLVNKAFKGCTVFKRMQKKDPLEWVILGAGDGRLVRATWYQKVGAMPKFEEYDMADKSNRQLYNKFIEESQTVPVKPVVPDSGPAKPNKRVGDGKMPIPDKPVNNGATTTEQQTIVPGNLNSSVLGSMSLAFAPPLDNDGWCAIIDKPATVANSKFEFRYERKSTGAKVTCFASATSSRTVEPLADNDEVTMISVLLGARKVGDFSLMKAGFAGADLALKVGNGSQFEEGSLTPTEMGATFKYDFSARSNSCFIAGKQTIAIPDGAKRLVLWIKSDGSKNKISARVADESGKSEVIDLGTMEIPNDRNGWCAVMIPLNKISLTGKLHWEALLAIDSAEGTVQTGTLELGPAAYEF